MISFCEEKRIFKLDTKNTSYMFGVFKTNQLMHLYWGAKLPDVANLDQFIQIRHKTLAPMDPDIGIYSTTLATMEYPTHGSADLRTPAFECTFDDGTMMPQLRYVGYKIIDGKPKLPGFPATYMEEGDKVQTLEVELVDSIKDLHVFLRYSVFEDYDVITRSTRVENRGPKCKLNAVMSASIDLPEGKRFDFMHFDGTTTRERRPSRTPVFCGVQTVDTKNGASGHFHNPFICFPEHNADEQHGDVYSMALVYSGEFIAGAHCDPYDTLRTFIGVNKFGFGYTLETGEMFQSPEAVLVYSDEGLGKMSRIWHKLVRERICRGKFRDVERYALINNWEATQLNFNQENLLEIVDKAKEIGLDMFVLDDGWFGRRVNEKSGLGDWFENRDKLPNGLKGLAEEVNKRGLKFGLWVEPEMISPNNCDLYDKHPDWVLTIPNRPASLGRWQHYLDLSRNDVCEYIIEAICGVLESANIEYVKWDMNRYMTEVSSALLPPERQCEVKYRYMLGLYRVLEEITSRFPDILFESCASGGGRYDLAMLYYMPQVWTSDNSDAAERLYIQGGTSMCYPYSTMGAHISACPSHHVGRTTPMKMRGNVAMPGQLGFELDLTKLSEADIAESARLVKQYKELGSVFHRGDLYRIDDPCNSRFASMNFVSEDKKTVVLCRYILATQSCCEFKFTRLQGLEKDKIYVDRDTGLEYSGAMLMNAGIAWHYFGDYESEIKVFEVKE